MQLGVEDDGKMVGLSDEELDASLLTLRAMTDALAADIVEVTTSDIDWLKINLLDCFLLSKKAVLIRKNYEVTAVCEKILS